MIYEFILPYQEDELELLTDSVKVGIDKGALDAINKGIKLDYILGDFDSISLLEYERIQKIVKNIIKLNPCKDDTDTEHAINYFKDASKIIIHGGIKGKRVEHLLANINLLYKYDNLVFKDDITLITNLKDMTITENKYKFISLFANEGSIVSLYNFKYPLNEYKFKEFDNLCISNEILNFPATIKFKGKGIIIFSKNDSL